MMVANVFVLNQHYSTQIIFRLRIILPQRMANSIALWQCIMAMHLPPAAHPLIEETQGFNMSHWLPLSGINSPRIVAAAAMVG
jgi:hypothetical protein